MEFGSRKRKKKRSVAGYVIVIVILLTLVALLAYEHYFPRKKLPVGTWVCEEDITADTDRAINEWLAPAVTEAAGSDYSAVTEAAGPGHSAGSVTDADHSAGSAADTEPVCINTYLVIGSDGTYTRYVDEESYAHARKSAYHSFSEALDRLINARFRAVGMTGDTGMTGDEIEALMNEAVGMGTLDYLETVVPDIMPSYDAYSADRAASGVCRIEDGRIRFDEGEGQTYLYDDERLLLGDVVYMRISNEE